MPTDSELNRVTSTPAFEKLRREIEARRKWALENPELATQWQEAWDEDAQRAKLLEAENARRMFKERTHERLTRMGVPSVVIDILRSARVTPATEYIHEWSAQREKPFLVLMGGVGSGKSIAAASALVEASQHSTVWTQASDIVRLSDYNVEHAHELDRITEARLLVIDDLGAEHASDFWVSRLDGIINHRYARALRTILTTNVDVARFKKQYGERVADRLHQVAMVRQCGTESLRRR